MNDTCLALDEGSALSTWFLVGQVLDNEPIRRIAIRSNTSRVGRRPECDLHLPNEGVSGFHSEITLMSDVLIVRDLGSTNGTFVNGIQITDPVTVRNDDILQFSRVAFRVQQQSSVERPTVVSTDLKRALVLSQLDKLINHNAVVPYFQPIVRLDSLEIVGQEVLARSTLAGLTEPHEMFRAATQLDLAEELSRATRAAGVRDGAQLPGTMDLYLNTHPAEVGGAGLIESLIRVRASHPHQSIVLEIHEAAITDPTSLRELQASLTALDIRLAYDDFGAGRTRLTELVEVPPNVLKFDMVLVRGIDKAPGSRQQMIAALVNMVVELGIQPLAEGVETVAEADTCRELGFEFAQGYHFGQPIPISNVVTDE